MLTKAGRFDDGKPRRAFFAGWDGEYENELTNYRTIRWRRQRRVSADMFSTSHNRGRWLLKNGEPVAHSYRTTKKYVLAAVWNLGR